MIFVDRLKYNERFPWVNYGIIVLNALVYLLVNVPLMVSGSINGLSELYKEWGFVGERFSFATLLTCLFLHGGPDHIIVNMLVLWIFGGNVERRLGHSLYLGVYLVTGVCGTLLFHAFNADPTLPLVGASGAISGIMGMYAIFFPRLKIDLIYGIPFIGWSGVMKVHAFVVMGLFFAKDVIEHFATMGKDEVAHLGHIGGFLSGAAIALVVRKLVVERSFILSSEEPSADDLQAEVQTHHQSSVIRRAAFAVGQTTRMAVLARKHVPFPPDKLPANGFHPAIMEKLRTQAAQSQGLYFRNLEYATALHLRAALQRSFPTPYMLLPEAKFVELPPSEAVRDADFELRGAKLRLGDYPVLVLPFREIPMAVAGRIAPAGGGEPLDLVALFAHRPWRRYILNSRILSFEMIRAQGGPAPGISDLAARMLKLKRIRVVNKGLVNLSAAEPMEKSQFATMEEFDTYTLWLLNMVGLAQ